MKKITLLFVAVATSFIGVSQTSFVNPDAVIIGGSGILGTPEVSQRGGQIMITHNNSQDITPGDEIACASATSFRNNSIYRDFDLAGDFGITEDFNVENAEIAIGPVSTPAGFPLTVNLYTVTGTFPTGTLNLLATEVITIENSNAETLINIPINATVPVGENLIYEVMLVDDGSDTNFMRFGANLFGQTGPTYIMAVDCGAGVPTPLTDLGLQNAIVMNILGTEGTVSIQDNLSQNVTVYPNPASDVLNISLVNGVEITNATVYDILGKDTGVVFINGQFNIAQLSKGIYMLSIETNQGTLTQKIVKK